MSSGESTSRDDELITRIKAGDQQAWKDLIEKYEGRLIAYVDCRIHNRSTSEDIVQEAFIGFLNSLANYDPGRSLESYLFSICAYKLTDHLRREGRRPKLQLRGIHEDDWSRMSVGTVLFLQGQQSVFGFSVEEYSYFAEGLPAS